MVPGLNPLTAPPALRVGPVLRPVEIPPGYAVPCPELIEPRREPLGAAGHRTIGLLALWHVLLCFRVRCVVEAVGVPTGSISEISLSIKDAVNSVRLTRHCGYQKGGHC